MAEEELASLEQRLAQCETELKVLLLPKDPNDERNVILEIRAGTGGDEASLARVRVPIGLDLGARSAPEIALAVLAEIQMVRAGASGQPLSARRR